MRASRILILALALLGVPRLAAGQILRGVVRSARTSLPIPEASVTVRDSSGSTIAFATTDSAGLWALRVRRRVGGEELRIRRLGFEMGMMKLPAGAPTDTLEYEFLLNEIAAAQAEVRVVGEESTNERRLNEAYRRGWKVYEPELVAMFRERSPDLPQLLRTIGTPSIYLPRGPNDCFRATRNNQCLTLVLDGQVLGPTGMILPNDIYFFAILGASEARVQFGDRAPWGAIAIYTRSRYDRYGSDRVRPRP